MDTARPLEDRRHWPRRAPVPLDGIVSARVRAGSAAEVINVCPRGALVETTHRLLPGTVLDLRIDGPHRGAAVRAQVIHCEVFAIVNGSLRYRGGVLFDRPLSWLGSPIDRRFGPEDSVSIRMLSSGATDR